ncbi:MAG: sigma-54-dependent Fis family transcriptional regulator [Myxococcales bacterium]|nr:sigma-54-dependent Fis family transcriptional regulator [Myxococcales bacterium]MCB9650866.1 sigma-54-dependent Fis family transcriptional regulator [Deltaproteobacteria bacterium]
MTSRGKILILDDEPNILVSLSRALELEDYTVITAKNLAEARVALEKSGPDLALFDVKLPDGDGLELMEALKKAGDLLPIIVMSGHGSIDDAVRAIQLGAVDYLEKPIGQDRLLLTIANTLELSRLKTENEALREEAREALGESEILGRSKAIGELKEQIDRVAKSEGRVLITGENGTGKELIAHAIHAASLRSAKPFVSLNCAAVPAELIESELFGHEKGAFTGAVGRKIGKFERAHQGTLFLDEVGDMPANMQAKLLRVLQTGELERVGGNDTIKVDVRVLAATNKDLEEEIREGRFREDLYYRLNVVPLVSPALRDRKEDIPLLAESFLVEAARRNHCRAPKLGPRALALLAAHDYPGNVRELRNLMERIVILAPPNAEVLDEGDIRHLVPHRGGGGGGAKAGAYRADAKLSDLVLEAERAIVLEALEAHDNVVADTARALGVERSNFHKKLKALGLR